LANPQFDKTKNSYVLFMDIYGKAYNETLGITTDNGQALTFSLWDAGTGRIYPDVDVVDVIGDKITFVGGTIKGTINAPQVFDATDKVEQQISLKEGWNWMSTNVVSTTPSLIDQFKTGMEAAGIQIKSRSGDYIMYSNGVWTGTEFTIDQTSLYLLKTSQAKTLKMVGAMAKSTDLPILINTNWNWIGYVPQFVAPIKDALSGLASVEGDQIKGQIGFATYSGGNWYGSLQYMMPGAGYMYNSMNSGPVSFKYPSQYFSQSKVAQQNEVTESMHWAVDAHKYQMSMTATCIASVNNQEVANADMQVAVFIGDECRGTATLKYVDAYSRYMAFLMVWGNTDDVNKKITFKSFNTTNNQELSLSDQTLSYVPDNIIGTPASPYKINFVVAGNTEVNVNQLKLYPNPVSDVLHFDCNPAGVEQVEVFDNVGRQLIGYSNLNKNSINVGNLGAGIYTLRIKYNGIVTNHLFVRK
jgi:Secretion system C-terminal sorting domain